MTPLPYTVGVIRRLLLRLRRRLPGYELTLLARNSENPLDSFTVRTEEVHPREVAPPERPDGGEERGGAG